MAVSQFGGLQANMGPFSPVNLRGGADITGVPDFQHKLPLTIGGMAGADVHFGRVVSINPALNRRQFVEGIPAGNVVKGIAMMDPSIYRANVGMGDYYWNGKPMTALTFGLMDVTEYDLSQSAPMEGSTVWARNSDGLLAFNDGTTLTGYTKLNAFVYETLDPNGAKVFFNLPLVVDQTREATVAASTPVADPAAGVVSAGTVVRLTTTTPNAKIYYSLDGTDPDSPFNSLLYNANSGIVISAAATIKAVAVKAGNDPSPVLTAAYTIS